MTRAEKIEAAARVLVAELDAAVPLACTRDLRAALAEPVDRAEEALYAEIERLTRERDVAAQALAMMSRSADRAEARSKQIAEALRAAADWCPHDKACCCPACEVTRDTLKSEPLIEVGCARCGGNHSTAWCPLEEP